MAKKIFDAVATTGTYTDKQGNEKKRYLTVGTVFEDDKGRMSLKLESLPVGDGWNGWVSFFTPKEQTKKPAAPSQNNSGGQFNDFEDDIPFN